MIEVTNFTPGSAALGGLLIGLGAVVLMGTLGRIAGISGMLGSVIKSPTTEAAWRWSFLAGLILAGAVIWLLWDGAFQPREGFPRPLLIIAGLLVGFGTALGSGCTSGHGVCGLSRFSVRSLVATTIFMMAGILTASFLLSLWVT